MRRAPPHLLTLPSLTLPPTPCPLQAGRDHEQPGSMLRIGADNWLHQTAMCFIVHACSWLLALLLGMTCMLYTGTQVILVSHLGAAEHVKHLYTITILLRVVMADTDHQGWSPNPIRYPVVCQQSCTTDLGVETYGDWSSVSLSSASFPLRNFLC